MTSPARILYALAGSPVQPGAKPLREPRACRICGLPTERAIPFASWIAPTATDWSCWQGPPEEPQVVCEACAWVRAGKPSTAVLWSPGAALTTSLRLYSHLWDEIHGWRWATLSGKRFLLDELWRTLGAPRGTRWFAAFSDGGLTAKQSLAYAHVQHVGSSVVEVVYQIEPVRITLGGPARWLCLACALEAYRAGWSKAEILACQAHPGRMRTLGIGRCADLAAKLRRWKASPELELAVWLAQREEESSADAGAPDPGEHPEYLVGSAYRFGEVVPRQPHEDVVADPGHDVRLGQADGEPGPLVHPDAAQPTDRDAGERCAGQLSLLDLVDTAGVVPRARPRPRRGRAAGPATPA